MAKVVGIISRKKAIDTASATGRLNQLITEVAGGFSELADRFAKQDYIFRYDVPEKAATTTTQVTALRVVPKVPSGLYRVKWLLHAEGNGTQAPVVSVYADGVLLSQHRFPATAAQQAFSGFYEGSYQSGVRALEIRVAASAAGTVTLLGGQLVLERLVA